jgi:hypothetical protein
MDIAFIQKIFGTLCCALAIMYPACQQDSYSVKISGPVTLGESWVELHPEPYLKPDKNIPQVVLDLEEPFKDDKYSEGKGPNVGKGILMPDGDVINPEIELVDQYGNVFNLIYGGSSGGAPVYLYPNNKLPRDREYKMVRLRSPRPIKCKAIYWFCESTKDWH